jgi:hypothetical protein
MIICGFIIDVLFMEFIDADPKVLSLVRIISIFLKSLAQSNDTMPCTPRTGHKIFRFQFVHN